MNTTTIEIPSVGMTEKPPWGALMVLANKRHENRVASVAFEAKRWIGQRIAITSSKSWDTKEALEALECLAEDAEISLDTFPICRRAVELVRTRLPPGKGYVVDRLEGWDRRRAGCIIAVAELIGVVKNGADPDGYWQVPGQWSLVLGRVWEVEPVPCTGGLIKRGVPGNPQTAMFGLSAPSDAVRIVETTIGRKLGRRERDILQALVEAGR